MQQVSPHPAYIVDEKTSEYWIVKMGDNFDDHFAVWEWLKISRNGEIEKMDSDGDWTIEYRSN